MHRARHAEALPFADGEFDAAMAVLSDHHWSDPAPACASCARGAPRGRLPAGTATTARFWLVRDYLPGVRRPARRQARRSTERRRGDGGGRDGPVPIPWDCVDGSSAYWRRPEAYLDENVRNCSSVWARLGPAISERAVAALRADLASGAWQQRNAELLALEEAELGARLLVASGP